jgi:GAF domain-containing protein
MIEGRTIHVHDLAAEVDTDYPDARELQRRDGSRTVLATPLLREGAAIGSILIRRTEVRPFTDSQIALLETFADQAVIAIENARLFRELQDRTRELARSVEELRALSEVGQAVSSSLDLQQVLKTIVTRAVELSGADGGAIYEVNGLDDESPRRPRLRAAYGLRWRGGDRRGYGPAARPHPARRHDAEARRAGGLSPPARRPLPPLHPDHLGHRPDGNS